MYVYRYLSNQEYEPMRAELLLAAFFFNWWPDPTVNPALDGWEAQTSSNNASKLYFK